MQNEFKTSLSVAELISSLHDPRSWKEVYSNIKINSFERDKSSTVDNLISRVSITINSNLGSISADLVVQSRLLDDSRSRFGFSVIGKLTGNLPLLATGECQATDHGTLISTSVQTKYLPGFLANVMQNVVANKSAVLIARLENYYQ